MSQDEFRVVRIAADYDLAAFDCGEDFYNSWLTHHALEANERGTSAVYLLVSGGSEQAAGKVCGYFAICPTLVSSDGAPKQIKGSLMRDAPGWLIAKLALDASLRGGTLGRELLREALDEILTSASRGGGQVIVVDAENSRVFEWYLKQGFLGTGVDNLRLYMKVSTAREYLGTRRP